LLYFQSAQPEKSTKKVGQQRDKHKTDQCHTATRDELLDPLRFRAWVIVAIPLQKVYETPNAQSGSKSDDECAQHLYATGKEFHIDASNSDFM
jgi:hypothetical protein